MSKKFTEKYELMCSKCGRTFAYSEQEFETGLSLGPFVCSKCEPIKFEINKNTLVNLKGESVQDILDLAYKFAVNEIRKRDKHKKLSDIERVYYLIELRKELEKYIGEFFVVAIDMCLGKKAINTDYARFLETTGDISWFKKRYEKETE